METITVLKPTIKKATPGLVPSVSSFEQRTFTLPEIKQYYPFNEISETPHGFLIQPSSPRKGRENLIIPKTLPLVDIYELRPADLTTPYGDAVVEELLIALDVEEYTELYSAECIFGDDQTDGFRITDPRKASCIRLMGIRERSGNGWMDGILPIEQRLTSIAKRSYRKELPYTDELLCAWILHTSFNTASIQAECAKRTLHGCHIYAD